MSEERQPIDIPGSSSKEAGARVRTTSEASEDGNSTGAGKRQRTTSQTFMVTSGLTSASPPKFVSLEEIMQAANGMKDMALVHHIAVDSDFRLKRVEFEDNSIQKTIKETMHRAFWDLLREEIRADPPKYDQALRLLEEVRNGLISLLLPQHTKLKQHITEVLDLDLIKQQVDRGILDFHHYAQYVISTMAKICAPVRDEKIKELTQTSDVVDTFKGILETLDLMALDMANFTIQLAKPDIIAHSVEIERKKFADILAIQPDGLAGTRKWLLEHVDSSIKIPPTEDYKAFIRNLTKQVFTEACIDLLEWGSKPAFPETFMLDEARLRDLSIRMNRVILTGTALLITVSNVGPDLQTLTSFKDTLKQHISLLLSSVVTEHDLVQVLPNVADQVVKDISETREAHNMGPLSSESSYLIIQQILEITKSDNRIRQLMRQRVKEFLQQIIESATANPQKVPSGLTALQQELTAIAGQFLRIVSHNSTVYCIYYFDIVAAALPQTT